MSRVRRNRVVAVLGATLSTALAAGAVLLVRANPDVLAAPTERGVAVTAWEPPPAPTLASRVSPSPAPDGLPAVPPERDRVPPPAEPLPSGPTGAPASSPGAGRAAAAPEAPKTGADNPWKRETEVPKEAINQPGVERSARPGAVSTPKVQQVRCPAGGTTVGTADELQAALAGALPGSVIKLRKGVYPGTFQTTVSGSAERPIWLCGDQDSVLDAGGADGYGLHLNGAKYWRLNGFAIRNAQKAVMADQTTGTTISGLRITNTGDEAIHLRKNSTRNLVSGNTIVGTGFRRATFGEGIYVGTAESNWCSITDCRPDRSDYNTIAGNTISRTTAEAVDIKEGTVGGLLAGNRFDGKGTTAADSLIDVKGTAWTIKDNSGNNAPLDGMQTHQILDRWGERNLFTGNKISMPARPAPAVVQAAGTSTRYGIAVRPAAGNLISCSNSVIGADVPISNLPCRQ